MNLACIKHPHYDGTKSPTLSCKTCCGIFVSAIKQRNADGQGQVDTYKWLEDKAREAQESGAKKPVDARPAKLGNPSSV